MYDFGPYASFFSVIKDFDEPFSKEQRLRLAKYQAPRSAASRFAPGLRHLIWKMSQREEKTKILFFITDGQANYCEYFDPKVQDAATPSLNQDQQDRKFGAKGPLGMRGEEYVFQDLLKVYQEAVMAGIKLFCITIDLPTANVMTRIFGKALIYLPKISDLPRKLVEIFRKVST